MRAALLALSLVACVTAAPEPPPANTPAGVDPVIAARAEGVDFRALGDRPDFLLHIYRDDRIFLAWDYGQNQEFFPKGEPIYPRWNGEIYETRNERHRLRVEIRHRPCRDVNGATHPAEVTIEIDGDERHGCGFAL